MSIPSFRPEINTRDELRRRAGERRRGQPSKDSVSEMILQRVRELPEFIAAKTVAAYFDVRHEVRTRQALPHIIADKEWLALPWCDGNRLRLCRIESLDELEPGRFGIAEPGESIRTLEGREVKASAADFFIVPGVAFDAQCGRLGHGRGFYDRLLSEAGESACLCGVAFDCQIDDSIPLAPHDVPMQIVVTESRVLRRR